MAWIATLCIIIITVFLLATGICIYRDTVAAHREELAKIVSRQPTGAEKKELNRLLRKHGVGVAEEEKGELIFYRNGEKCKLR